MTAGSKLETVKALIGRIRKGLQDQEFDKVKEACEQLGPHVTTLKRHLATDENPEETGYAEVGAGISSTSEASAVMKMENAALIAAALQTPTVTIAECVEEVLRIADSRCEMNVVQRITRWLTKNPEFGLILTIRGVPDTWRPVQTWRLHEVHPTDADAWTEAAQKLMRSARLRAAPR